MAPDFAYFPPSRSWPKMTSWPPPLNFTSWPLENFAFRLHSTEVSGDLSRRSDGVTTRHSESSPRGPSTEAVARAACPRRCSGCGWRRASSIASRPLPRHRPTIQGGGGKDTGTKFVVTQSVRKFKQVKPSPRHRNPGASNSLIFCRSEGRWCSSGVRSISP